jgi:RHS repeat-associated protein
LHWICRTLAHNGLTTVTTNFRNYTATRIQTAWGDVARITAGGGDTNYSYDGFAQLTQVSDAYNNVTSTIGYNVRGMKTSMTDADLGAWTYTPNALGELVSQTDAKGQIATFQYDLLGRMTKRSEGGGDTDWSWDTYAGNTRIGKLMRVANPSYAEQFWYDSQSRLTQRQITVEGVNHLYNYAYHSSTGFLDTLEYPTSTPGNRFKVKYEYSFGDLVRVSRSTSPFTEYWKLNQLDARRNQLDVMLGNVTQVINDFDPLTGTLETRTAGPSGSATLQDLEYDWDANGNLTRRHDARRNLTEIFTYDSLDRMTQSTLNGTTNLTVAYNLIGNITSKSDVGSFTYDATKKHAVRTAGSNSYSYDANGNMTSRLGHSITWTSYNYPSVINAPNSRTVSFSYAPDRSRWKMVTQNTTSTETTLYLGGLFEIMTPGTSPSRYRHTITANGEPVAILTRLSSGSEAIRYILKDHLGSVDGFATSTGTLEIGESFTAFGDRRDANTWSGPPTASDRGAMDAITRQGFTYHTTLGATGLTHMNGRVHDAVNGRFLSADPVVPDPYDGQSLNRYSYVRNNPLSFTDPSGFTEVGCDCGGWRFTFSFGFDFSYEPFWSYSLSFVHPNGLQNRVTADATPVTGEVNAYNSKVEAANKENRWWSYVKTGASVVADFVPVVGQVKGGYEAYQEFNRPGATKWDKFVAVTSISPVGKVIKLGEKAVEGVKAATAAKAANKLPANARTTIDPQEVYRRLEKFHGIDPAKAGDRLHDIKKSAGLGPADNVVFDLTGNVYDKGGNWLGSLTAGGG